MRLLKLPPPVDSHDDRLSFKPKLLSHLAWAELAETAVRGLYQQ